MIESLDADRASRLAQPRSEQRDVPSVLALCVGCAWRDRYEKGAINPRGAGTRTARELLGIWHRPPSASCWRRLGRIPR